MCLLVPSARWAEADAALAEVKDHEESAATRLAFLAVAGGLAFRRGDAKTSKQLLEELQPLALASGELQRIIPMAGVVLPWLARTGELEELRSLIDKVLAVVDRHWPAVLDAVPTVRALAAAGETELLARTIASIRGTPSLAAIAQTARVAGEGLLALLEGRAGEAVEQLERAAERERQLGRTFPAACLELDLAEALEAAGETASARNAQARAETVLAPLGCVNPF
jgi:hypothetical protein